MKQKEATNETWPELDEAHRTQTQDSSATPDKKDSNELTSTTTKDDTNQTFYDTEQTQQQSTS